MVVLLKMIINYNNAITTSYIMDVVRYPELSFQCQSINVPDVTLDPITTQFQDVRAKIPANVLNWSGLTATMVLDEDLLVYELLYNWMVDARHKKLPNIMNDIRITSTDSNKISNFSFVFEGAWVSNITGFSYFSALDTSNPITIDVIFEFQNLKIERLKPLNFRIGT